MIEGALEWVAGLIADAPGSVGYVTSADPYKSGVTVVEPGPNGYTVAWYSAGLKEHTLNIRLTATVNEARSEVKLSQMADLLVGMVDEKEGDTYRVLADMVGDWPPMEAQVRRFTLDFNVIWRA